MVDKSRTFRFQVAYYRGSQTGLQVLQDFFFFYSCLHPRVGDKLTCNRRRHISQYIYISHQVDHFAVYIDHTRSIRNVKVNLHVDGHKIFKGTL